MQRLTILIAIALVSAPLVAAAEDAISTDRPDFVESSDVLARGVFQIETGVSVLRDRSDEVTRTVGTPTLLRYGIGNNVELRVETDGRVEEQIDDASGSTSSSGFSDLSLGMKWRFRSDEIRGPSMAVLLHADIPSGSDHFRGVGIRPSLRAVAEWQLNSSTSLGVMPGIVYDQNDRHRFVSGLLAVTTALQFTEHLHGFAEIAGQQFARTDDGGNVITYDTGLAYVIGTSVQLDCFMSRGANDNAPDWVYGVGVSIRFP